LWHRSGILEGQVARLAKIEQLNESTPKRAATALKPQRVHNPALLNKIFFKSSSELEQTFSLSRRLGVITNEGMSKSRTFFLFLTTGILRNFEYYFSA
jgi:hypothetical protein